MIDVSVSTKYEDKHQADFVAEFIPLVWDWVDSMYPAIAIYAEETGSLSTPEELAQEVLGMILAGDYE